MGLQAVLGDFLWLVPGKLPFSAIAENLACFGSLAGLFFALGQQWFF